MGFRRNQPYDCYSELDFKIPVGTNGDCFERFLVRIEEMRQSILIIEQCLKKFQMGIVFPMILELFHQKRQNEIINGIFNKSF